MNRKYLLLPLLPLLVCLFFACSTERDPCLDPLDIKLTVKFKRAVADTGTATTDTIFSRIIINPVNNPNKFTDSGVAGSTVNISLSPLSNSCSWYVQPSVTQPNKKDTITFNYTIEKRFLSNACGYVNNYNITSIGYTRRGLIDTLHNVDSVILNDGVVNGVAGKTNITVYFKKP